ncbi:MAG: acetate--CoA ligase family protein, partial [Chloroflexota bacterium]
LIGATPNRRKLGYGVLRNLTQFGFQGQVYPVNPNYQQINDLACYPEVVAVPDPVDLAVIVLPAQVAPATLEACGRRGIRAAIIISGGFKEVGPGGAALEQDCLAVAQRYGIRLIGPNCIGTMDLHTGLNTTFVEGVLKRGGIGFVSQSGGVCGSFIAYVGEKYLGFSRFVSLGNAADVNETDIIAYLADDPNTRVIAVYVEAIADGRRFMEVARRVSRQKPIVLLKAGRTEAGGRAISSHTGSLAGSNAAYEAAFSQSGVIEVDSISELFDISVALAYQPSPAGHGVLVLTNSGGPAALAADHLASAGMGLTDLTPPTQEALRSALGPTVQIGNPTDMLGGAGPAEFESALRLVMADPAIDSVVVLLVSHLLLDPIETATRICRLAPQLTKPILTCFMGEGVAEARRILHEHHIPMYDFPEAASRALSAMCRYADWRKSRPEQLLPDLNDVNLEAVRQVLARPCADHALGEADTRPVLEAYHIPIVAGRMAHNPAEAVEIAAELGYPVVLKIVSPDILHKSEAGGIRLNLADAEAVTAAYHQLLANMAATHPTANLVGVLVEKMAPAGQEVIVGMRRDPQFGPLLMFGLGGIYVELLTDLSFRVAPIDRTEALAMIHETKAGRLLAGVRGQAAADIEAVVDCILRLSQLALDFSQIEEVEVNPLLALPKGQGAVALDGRVILN